MADDLVTELSHLAKNLEQAADPCAAREARLLRRAIAALTPIIPKYERYEPEANASLEGDFHANWRGKLNSDLDVLDSLVKPEKPKDAEPNAHVEGAPV